MQRKKRVNKLNKKRSYITGIEIAEWLLFQRCVAGVVGGGEGEEEGVDFSVLPFPSPDKASYASSVGFCVSLVYKKAATVMLFIRSTKTTLPLERSYQYHRVYILLLSFHCANNYSSQYVPI